MLYFDASKYFVTTYHSDWAKEGQPETVQLTTGKKIVDTKLGTRAAMHAEPFFELGLNEPAKENEGNVVLGTIAWTGNFRFTFEVDNVGGLRVIPAINPYASDYKLKAGETFTTPEFIFTTSSTGIGQASRNLHDFGAPGAVTNEKTLTLRYALAFGRMVEEKCPDVRVIFTRIGASTRTHPAGSPGRASRRLNGAPLLMRQAPYPLASGT